MRLYSYLKINGGYTLKEIKELLLNNKVMVNNEYKTMSYSLKDDDLVYVDNKLVQVLDKIYYLYYKPKGVLSVISNKEESYINHINVKSKVMPAGRLDKESEGLMLLTNDGLLIDKICNPKTHSKKEYIVTLLYPITDLFIEKLNQDHILRGKTTKEKIIKVIDLYTISIILFEGMYHEIRRIVISSGNRVKNLKRIKIGEIGLDDLKPNELKEINIDFIRNKI